MHGELNRLVVDEVRISLFPEVGLELIATAARPTVYPNGVPTSDKNIANLDHFETAMRMFH